MAEQPAPVHNNGPSMHDLVTADLNRKFPGRYSVHGVLADLAERKQVGLDRYGTILQAHNGRDALRDLYEELQDASVYARQVLEEGGLDPVQEMAIRSSYNAILVNLLSVRAVIDGRAVVAHG